MALFASACAGNTESAGPSVAPGASASGAASADPGAGASAPADRVHLGVSNAIDDDGWHEAMICSVRAQAGSSGDVAELTVSDRVTDAAGQMADLRNLVAIGVDAIVVNPVTSDGADPAIQEAIDAGIPVVRVERGVVESAEPAEPPRRRAESGSAGPVESLAPTGSAEPVAAQGVIAVGNDQEAYGYVGAKWLFETMGGKGSVVYMRGDVGDPVDTQRDVGFQRALTEFPDVKIATEIETDWDQATAVEGLNAFLATEKKFAGIWTSGIDSVVVDALRIAEHPFVPIVGSDHGAFVSQLLTEQGLVGAAVTDPAAIGGAGVTLALQALGGQASTEPVVSIAPELWDNTTAIGTARLTAANDPDVDLAWPLKVSIPGLTSYTTDELIACGEPGN